MIQSLAVMLRTMSAVSWRMVSHSRTTTSFRVSKISLRKPMVRSCFQICSIGFISGVYGGIGSSLTLEGTTRVFDLCHAAPSQTIKMVSFGYVSDNSFRNTFVHVVSQEGITRKKLSPVIGSTAPKAYRYSRI